MMLIQDKRLNSVEWAGKMIVNSEYVRIYNKAVVTYFKALFLHLHGEIYEKRNTPVTTLG
jgi:hypothetical protein